MRGAAKFGMVLLLAGCAQTSDTVRTVGSSAPSFDPKQVGKSDIDRVADAHRRAIFASLRVLAEKLYRRNPREWKKAGHASIEKALDRLLDPRTGWRVSDAAGRSGTDAILLSLQADFEGDRVAVFIAGMGGMLNAAFEEKTEFFMFDELNAQKIHNARDAGGAPLLLSNEIPPPGQPANLSFEREFGKMIGNLDILSALLAEKGHRIIARVVQNLATAVFLPVRGL
jgi:hypothetical protein